MINTETSGQLGMLAQDLGHGLNLLLTLFEFREITILEQSRRAPVPAIDPAKYNIE